MIVVTKKVIVLLVLLVLIIFINLGYLNYRQFFHQNNLQNQYPVEQFTSSQDQSNFSSVTKESSQSSSLNSSDFRLISDMISEATASLTRQVDSLTGQSSSVKPVPISKDTTSRVKEYYIPLGSGTTSGQDWTDLPGVEAYVAPTNYGKIKEMYFEAGIRIPSGNGRVYARLKNVTDNNGLFESEVYRDGNTTGMLSSGKLPIPTTTKLYRVQMKSTLGVEVNVDSARIKIFVE